MNTSPQHRRLEALFFFGLALGYNPGRAAGEKKKIIAAQVEKVCTENTPESYEEFFRSVRKSGVGGLDELRRAMMLRFAFGALSGTGDGVDGLSPALMGWSKVAGSEAERLMFVRAAAGVLDSLGRHNAAEKLILESISGIKNYSSGLVFSLGLPDWFGVVEPLTVRHTRLGHLPPWLDRRLSGVAGRLRGFGAAAERDRRIILMLSAWEPEKVEALLRKARLDGDRIGGTLGTLLLASFYHNSGDIEHALPFYEQAYMLAGDRLGFDLVRIFSRTGRRVRHRAWRWLDCEAAAASGPWKLAAGVLRRLELAGMPVSYGEFLRVWSRTVRLGAAGASGKRGYMRLIKYYPNSEAADAARLRLAELDRSEAGDAWLWQIVAGRTRSKFYELALARLVVSARSDAACGELKDRLMLLALRWSHRNRRRALLKAVERCSR